MSDMAVMPRGSGEEVGNERKSASDCAGEVASSRESFDHLRYSSLASAGVGNGLVDVRAHPRELVLVILELFPLIGERDGGERRCAGLNNLSHIIDNLFGEWSGGSELWNLRRPIREGDEARRAYSRFRLRFLLGFLLCVFFHHLFYVRHLDAHFLRGLRRPAESCLCFFVRVLSVRKPREHEGEKKHKRQEVRFHGADVSTAENAKATGMRRTKPSRSGLTNVGGIESGIQQPRKKFLEDALRSSASAKRTRPACNASPARTRASRHSKFLDPVARERFVCNVFA